MDKLIFPSFNYKIREEESKNYIFDIIRKKYILITPEEWVRQHLVHYLIDHMNYPKALIKIEDGMKVNKMQKRSDVVVYCRTGDVFMLVECKSSKIGLDQKVMDQLSVYNKNYKAEYLVVTNGVGIAVCKIDYQKKQTRFLNEFPEFS